MIPVVERSDFLLHAREVHLTLETQTITVDDAVGPGHPHQVSRGARGHVLEGLNLTLGTRSACAEGPCLACWTSLDI